MEQLKQTIRQMIAISELEMSDFLSRTHLKPFKKQDVLSQPGKIPNDFFYFKLNSKLKANDPNGDRPTL